MELHAVDARNLINSEIPAASTRHHLFRLLGRNAPTSTEIMSHCSVHLYPSLASSGYVHCSALVPDVLHGGLRYFLICINVQVL